MASKTKKSIPSFAGLDTLLRGTVDAETKEATEHCAELEKMKLEIARNPAGKTRDGSSAAQLKERIEWHGSRVERIGKLCKEVRESLTTALKDAKAVAADDVLAVTKAWRTIQLQRAAEIFGNSARKLFTEALNSVVAA